jgi:DnaJ-class molecular chaperone
MFFNIPNMQPPVRQQQPSPDLYKILNVERSASSVEIKKAYRVLALKYHPDKSTNKEDGEKFKEINNAYEILMDPERKNTYDQFGVTSDDAQHQQQQQQQGMPDIFSQMFNFQERGPSGQRRGSDTIHHLNMSLEELYTGKMFKLKISREEICAKCTGKGGLIMQSCPGCSGTGRQTSMRALGPGFMQQVQSLCAICKGIGQIAQDKCTECNGTKTKCNTSPIEVTIPAGTVDGDRHIYNGMGNAAPGMSAGDVIFVVKQMPHRIFSRQGNDLLIDVSLTLRQSLCGFNLDITHVDGSTISLQSEQGRITKPESQSRIGGKGLTSSGCLVVTYKVQFPDTVRDCADIAECLPALIGVNA